MAFESQSLKEKKYSGAGVFGDVFNMALLPKVVELDKETTPTLELRFQVPDLNRAVRVRLIFYLFFLHFAKKNNFLLVCLILEKIVENDKEQRYSYSFYYL